MYVLSKFMLKNHSNFFRYILLLAGDIELNSGPVRQTCTICSKPVNKRSLFCINCNIATHKRCIEISVPDASKYKCHKCEAPTQNHNPKLFPFSNVYELGDLNNSINTQPNEENDDNEIWQPLKKSGLLMIHLNINSILNKIHELRLIAQKSNPSIGITESKLDDSVLNSEVNIDGYTLYRSDRTRNGIGVKERQNFSKDTENIFVDKKFIF